MIDALVKLINRHCPLFKGDERKETKRIGAEGVKNLQRTLLDPLRFVLLRYTTLVPLEEGTVRYS